MNIKRQSLLNYILDKILANTVVLSSWLKKQGVSNSLQQSYKRNGWLEPIGQGAFLKFSSKNAYVGGGIYMLYNHKQD
jgi:phenolic acid decarboxylase